MQGRYTTLIKNMLIFGLGLLGSKFVQFMLLPYFTNVLSTAEYGTIDLTVTFVGLAVPVVSLELSDAMLRFGLSEDTDKKSLFKNGVMVLLGASLFVLLLSPLLVFYKSISPWKWYIVILVVLQCFKTNFALFVKAENKVVVYSVDSILTALVTAGADVVLLSVYRRGISGYFTAEILGNLVSVCFLFLAGGLGRYWEWARPVDWKLLTQMLKYSVPLMFNAVSWWITSFSDRVVLDLFFSSTDVGIYSVAAKVPSIITTLLSVFTQAWIISAVKEYEKERNVLFFEKIYHTYSALLFSMVSVVMLLIRPMMKVYVGEAFYGAWYYVPLLLIGTAFLGISNYYGAVYAAAKANLLEIKSTILCAGSNLLLNLLLIPRLDILGAVLATMMSYVIVVIVRIVDTKKIMKLGMGKWDLGVGFCLLSLEAVLVMHDCQISAALTMAMVCGMNFRKVVRVKSLENSETG